MSSTIRNTGTGNHTSGANAAGSHKHCLRPIADHSTNNFLSHSVSPTNNNRTAKQLQQYLGKKSLNIKRANLNAKTSLQQPQILRNIKKQQVESEQQQIGASDQRQSMNLLTVGKIITFKNKQYQKQMLKGAIASKEALHLPASKTSAQTNLEPIIKVKSPAVAAGSIDDLEKNHRHYQTLRNNTELTYDPRLRQLEGPDQNRSMHEQEQAKTAEQGSLQPSLNSSDQIPASKAGPSQRQQPQRENDHPDISSSQRLSTQQLQYRLQCCSSRTTSNDTPYRNRQIERIFKSSKNGSSLRNKDQTASVQNKRSNSPPDGRSFMQPMPQRQATSRQLNRVYQSSDSSIEREKNTRAVHKDGPMSLQRQPSWVSDENQQNQLILSQDISKQIIRKSVIASTHKLILNPKQIIYAAGSSSSIRNDTMDNQESAQRLDPNGVEQKRQKAAASGGLDHIGQSSGLREPSVDGQPIIQEWEELDSSQICREDKLPSSANDRNSVQKVRFRMSKLNQSKKFSTPVDHISPQESGPASSADISPTKIPQQEEPDGRMQATSTQYKQKQYLVTEVDIAQPAMAASDINGSSLGIKQIQSEKPYDHKLVNREGLGSILNNSHRKGNGSLEADRSHLLNFNSPSSIKIIDLKQPNVRKLLMDSLQELVKERKHKMHQKESWQFNDKYDAIIKNTIQNRRVNIEKAIPTPQADAHECELFGIAGQIDQSSMGDLIAGGATVESGSGGMLGQQMHSQYFDEASLQSPNLHEWLPEHSIISRSDLSMQLKIQADKAQSQNPGTTVTKKQSLSQLEMNFQNGTNFNVAHGDKQGLITPRQQQRLITKLNEIYEAQLLNDAQERNSSAGRSPLRDLPPSDNNKDDMIFEGAITTPGPLQRDQSPSSRSRPGEYVNIDSIHYTSEPHSPFVGNIFSVINNDKLYYIANDATTSQSQMSRLLQIHQQVSQRSLNEDEVVAAETELLIATQNTLHSINDHGEEALEDDFAQATNDQLAVQTFSRNNNKFDSQQIMVQQVSTDKKTNFIQQADLISLKNYQKYIKKDPNQMRERFVTKVPSVSDLTFFDLSNPLHLNQLFTRLEDIQQQEIAGQDKREMPKAIQNQSKIDHRINYDKDSQIQQSGYNSPHIQQEQSGEESGNVSSHQTHTPIHSRQGVEQAHSIDVDLLIQKLLKVPNVDVLDSIFSVDSNVSQRLNINLQPSNGTGNSGETNNNGVPIENANQISTKEMIQRVTGNIEDILNFKPQVGESSLSSGGHGSEIQSSGMMTPKSQKSLSTPNQIKLLQERNFNIQGFRFPIQSLNQRGGTDCLSNQQLRDINFYPPAPADDQNQIQSGGIIEESPDLPEAQIMTQGKQLMNGESIQCHDLMSPMTKKLLMQKLKEVQEQIGDSQSNDSLSDNEPTNSNNPGGQLSRNIVDGVVAGSKPDPQIFGNDPSEQEKRNKHLKSFYDPQTGALVQRALDNTRHHKTKLIISQIDEEDENLQFDEDEEMLQQQKDNRDGSDQIKLNTKFEPSPRNINQEYPSHLQGSVNDSGYQLQIMSTQSAAGRVAQASAQQQTFNSNANNMPQIDLLIQKLKQLEMQQRLRASEHQYSAGSQEQNLNMQKQSLSHGTSHNQSRTNMQESSQCMFIADVVQSNSCEKVASQQESKQSSLGHSSCSSPLKVGNINIYNMPKSHEQNVWLGKHLDEGKHKVSHQSIHQQKPNNNSSPEHTPQATNSWDPQQCQDQVQINYANEASIVGSLLQQSSRVNARQRFDGAFSSKVTGAPTSADEHARHQQPSAFMSRNHSVANILEQVIKRLEGLKSKE